LTPQRRVVVVGAGFGGGHESVAEAIADALRRHRGARVRVASLDLLARCAPRSAQLAAIAYRGGEEYFPDGTGTLATMVAAAPEDPLLRELVTGGIASARAALDALEPDIVIAAHPVAGAIAAEVSERCGFVVVSVVGDLWPQRLWVHPAVRLYFVGGTPARDALTARGVEWARAVVSGVPVSGPPGRAAARARLLASSGLAERFTVLVSLREGPLALAEDLAGHGIQALVPPIAGRRTPRAGVVVATAAGCSHADLISASDLVVCDLCGPTMWEAPAAGVPMLVIEPVTAMERGSVDLLATAGAALVARDGTDAVRRAAYLAADPGRVAAMAATAKDVGRPVAARAICERALAEIG